MKVQIIIFKTIGKTFLNTNTDLDHRHLLHGAYKLSSTFFNKKALMNSLKSKAAINDTTKSN